MTLKPLTSVVASAFVFCACGVPEQPTRVDQPLGAPTPNAPSAQRFALTSVSTDGWSLSAHAAVAAANADFTYQAQGCRGGLTNVIASTRFSFCLAGKGFASISDVPATVANCESPFPNFVAGGSYGRMAIGDGYVVMVGTQPVGQLRVADQTLIPESWDNQQPVQVTLEFSDPPAMP